MVFAFQTHRWYNDAYRPAITQITKEVPVMPQFFSYVVYSNTVLKYLIFTGSLLISFVVIWIVGHVIFKHLASAAQKRKPSSDGLLVKSVKRYVMPAAYFTAFYLSTKILVIAPKLQDIINMAVLAFTAIMAALFVSSVIVLLFNKYWENKQKDANKELAVKTIAGLLKIVIWSVAVILFLDNIGVKITTLVAGIGIGGVAIAFAAQSILGDIFCFFTIFFDRPFEIGDFIVAGQQMGTVEHIGLKTTRLRALSGEQLIFSNTDLTGSRIQNFKTMEQRRVLFTLGVTYDTPSEKLREIPALIKDIIDEVPDTAFGRAHFCAYGDYSLKFEIAYFVLNSDYDTYMDIHQEVNLRIKNVFDKNGVTFAYPTQTVCLAAPSVTVMNE
jgi:small-conductance mechanosensitive channel